MKAIFLNMAGLFVLVDDEDHAWACQWLWSAKPSRKKKNGTAPKLYAYRTGWRCGIRQSIYLHVEICERLHGPAPSRRRRIAEHGSSDSLDCRRGNIKGWVTPRQNRRTAVAPAEIAERPA